MACFRLLHDDDDDDELPQMVSLKLGNNAIPAPTLRKDHTKQVQNHSLLCGSLVYFVYFWQYKWPLGPSVIDFK